MKSSVVALMMTAFLAVGIVQAQPGPRAPRPDEKMRGRGMEMMEGLNLTPDQQKKLDEERADFQRSMVKSRSAVQLAQIDLGQLMQGDKPDRNAIGKKMKEISDLEYQQKLARLDHMFAVRDMLTPEQRELWKDHHRGEGPMWGDGPQVGCRCPGHDGPGFNENRGFRGGPED